MSLASTEFGLKSAERACGRARRFGTDVHAKTRHGHNKALIYASVFATAAEMLRIIAADPTHLSAHSSE